MAEEWTAEDVEKIVCNPIYTGIGPYPPILSDSMWIKANLNAMEEMGRERWLRRMLAELRLSLAPTPDAEEE